MTTRREFLVALGGLGLMATGCGVGFPRPATEKVQHPGFPYHPLAFHLDLAAFAYHLYGQSLAFPFDPYYEELGFTKGVRPAFMEKVRAWAKQQGALQKNNSSALNAYRGPGVLGSFPDNAAHDPIVYRYDRLYPWSHCITSPEKRWLIYKTPDTITKSIKDVYVAFRPTGKELKPDDVNVVSLEKLSLKPTSSERKTDAADILLCFEGGTGDKGEKDQPHSQSLMGYVLLRWDGSEYDVHICFRGSRSGSAARAALEALNTLDAKGNPDWITDLGWFQIGPKEGAAAITNTGKVYRGFANSMLSILPSVFRCLQEVSTLAKGTSPRNIYVTGHSLGGGLAQHFAGAVLKGSVYGPDGAGTKMPTALKAWPWKNLKLITFSAPRTGNEEWAKAMTEDVFQSRFWSHPVFHADMDAFTVKNEEIVPRLLNKNKPVAYRVLISNDPITTEKIVGGKHIGQTVYVDAGRSFVPSASSHEVYKVRELMTKTLNDDRIPNELKNIDKHTWEYRKRDELPGGPVGERGGAEEMKARVNVIKQYYDDHQITHQHEALERELNVFLNLLKS
jgi:hypothetical protein